MDVAGAMMIVKKDILQGWNEIATYLSRDVRTVKRWEKQRGLPVRRMQGDGRANVYAFLEELDLWLSTGKAAEPIWSAEPDLEAVIAEASSLEEPPSEMGVTVQVPDPLPTGPSVATKPVSQGRRRVLPWMWAVSAVCACLLTTALISRRSESSALKHFSEGKRTSIRTGLESSAARTTAPRLQQLCMQGSYLFEQRTPETLEKAKLDFDEAIATDATYAPAYVGLAKVYDLLREYSMVSSAQAFPLAKQAAQHAIALDPKLAEAHAALGFEEFFWEWDSVSAEREFRTAIALDPGSALAHQWYGSMLMHQSRLAEALEELDRAQVLHPASAGVLRTRAYALGLSGRRNEAADLLQEILTKIPDSAPLHFILAQLSLQEPRDIPRYLEEIRRFAELRHDNDAKELVPLLERVYQRKGERAMWSAMLDRQEHLHPAPAHRTYQMVQAEGALGENEAVLRDLTQLVRDHDPAMTGLKIEPLLSSVRGDPRFAEVLDGVGLPH